MGKKRKNNNVGEELKGLADRLGNRLWKLLTDMDKLKERCTAPISDFELLVRENPRGKITQTADGPLLYLDRNADVLAVAHLDAVGNFPGFFHGLVENETWVFSPWLDDRLGVFLLLDVLPAIGLRYDILLCTNEEKGASTAYHFDPPKGKTWRYLFELDRAGTDVVNYQYNCPPLSKALQEAGFPYPMRGSYTDIVELEHLDTAAFNVGVAYENAHTKWCRANLNETYGQMLKTILFYLNTPEDVFVFNPQMAFNHRRRRGIVTKSDPVEPYYGQGYLFDRKTPEHFPFRLGDQVRSVKDGRLYTIYTEFPASYLWARKSHEWSVKRVEPDGATVWTFLYEDDMEFYDPETNQFIPLEVGMNEPKKEKKKDKPKTETTAQERNRLSWEMLLKAHGNPTIQEVRNARVVFESLYFANKKLVGHSIEPWPDGRDHQIYKYGDRVETSFGLGVIDCDYPVRPVGDDHHYWVRHDVPGPVDSKEGISLWVDLLPSGDIRASQQPTPKTLLYPQENGHAA